MPCRLCAACVRAHVARAGAQAAHGGQNSSPRQSPRDRAQAHGGNRNQQHAQMQMQRQMQRQISAPPGCGPQGGMPGAIMPPPGCAVPANPAGSGCAAAPSPPSRVRARTSACYLTSRTASRRRCQPNGCQCAERPAAAFCSASKSQALTHLLGLGKPLQASVRWLWSIWRAQRRAALARRCTAAVCRTSGSAAASAAGASAGGRAHGQ